MNGRKHSATPKFTRRQKQKGRHEAGPFLANDEPKLRLQPHRTRPRFRRGGDIGQNHFGVFDFFFFFAMMKSSRFGPADQVPELLFENPRTDHTFRIGYRRTVRNCFFKKSFIFQKLNERSCDD